MRSAAFSATPYSVLWRWALIWSGRTEASTTRTFAVSYTFSCASTTPPRLRFIIAAVPIGCETAEKPPDVPSLLIHFFQSASEPPSPLSGTVASPGTVSPTEERRSARGEVERTLRERRAPAIWTSRSQSTLK